MTIGSDRPSLDAEVDLHRGSASSQPERGRCAGEHDDTRTRIRVVHLVWTLDIGGLEKMVLELAGRLDTKRFQTHVVCLSDPGTLAARFEAGGIPVTALASQRLGRVGSLVRLARILRDLKPHILHTHNPTPHFRGALTSLAAHVPVLVHTKHGRNYTDQPRTLAANWFASCLSDCIVCVSDDAAEVALRLEKVSARKIQVIRNGVDVSAFPAQGRSLSGRTASAIHVGRLNFIKDQRSLLRATRLVVDQERAFQLSIVGDGPDRQHLETLCERLSLREHVHFLGFRDDVREFLAQADMFVLASISEGISLTLLEAMAASLPVVATRVGGNPEVVIDQVTGLLVPPEAPEALAEAMLKLVREADLARRMGSRGRTRAQEEFDIRRVVGRYEALYLSLLAKKQRRRVRGVR